MNIKKVMLVNPFVVDIEEVIRQQGEKAKDIIFIRLKEEYAHDKYFINCPITILSMDIDRVVSPSELVRLHSIFCAKDISQLLKDKKKE